MTQSRPLNPNIKLVRFVTEVAFNALLYELKQLREDNGIRKGDHKY